MGRRRVWTCMYVGAGVVVMVEDGHECVSVSSGLRLSLPGDRCTAYVCDI
jgi:hypothetical protein